MYMTLVCSVLSCLVLSCLVFSCLVLSCLVLSGLVLSCLILSCLVLSCLVLSCFVLSWLVLSCLVLSCPSLNLSTKQRLSNAIPVECGNLASRITETFFFICAPNVPWKPPIMISVGSWVGARRTSWGKWQSIV